MTLKTYILMGASAAILAGCGQADTMTKKAAEAPQAVKAAANANYAEAPAGDYQIEKTHAYITFSYVHQGYSKPLLRWRNWDSTLSWDPENPENSSVTVDIKVVDIDSGVDVFDDHLRSADWFDAETYPNITFASTSVSKTAGDRGTITGDLTIKGMTKPVTLDVTFNKAGYSARSKSHKLGFSAKANLKRSDWGLGNYAPAVSDEVDLIIEVEYEKPE